ncbi:MAG: OmpA family protein [Ruegeria sp.]|uniref:OmpA family protein n=1 Tax=Ruegeria sp. TaxID=1879320 RepID=UPI00349EE7AB
MLEQAAGASEYGAFETGYFYLSALVLTVISATQLIFPKTQPLFPDVPRRPLILRVISVLNIAAVGALVWMTKNNPEVMLALPSLWLWILLAAIAAILLYLACDGLMVKTLNGVARTKIVAIVGPWMYRDVKRRFKASGQPIENILSGVGYNVNAAWPKWSQAVGYVLLFVFFAVAQTGIVSSLLLMSMDLADPPITDVTLDQGDQRIRTIPAQFVFETDKRTISDPAGDQMTAELAEIVAFDPVLVLVRGHTDSVGDDAYNMKLSQDRASAVADWLSRQPQLTGVVIRSEGLGSMCPRFDEGSRHGDALALAQQNNRRVELMMFAEAEDMDAAAGKCQPNPAVP